MFPRMNDARPTRILLFRRKYIGWEYEKTAAYEINFLHNSMFERNSVPIQSLLENTPFEKIKAGLFW